LERKQKWKVEGDAIPVLHFPLKEELGRGSVRGCGEPVRSTAVERADEALEVEDTPTGGSQLPDTGREEGVREKGKLGRAGLTGLSKGGPSGERKRKKGCWPD
jgi:hypothetical protein